MPATPTSLIVLALLCIAAWRDFATRTIPNAIAAAIAALEAAHRVSADGWPALALSAAVSVGLFLLLVPLQMRGILGAADTKLLAALGLGLPPLECYRLVATSVLCGGVLAMVYILAGRLARRHPPGPVGARRHDAIGRVLAAELWRIRRSAAVPYGVAIAAGAVLTMFNQSGA